MTHYLIEFRFHGKAKYESRLLSSRIHSRFRIRTEQHPHITLVGPFYTNDETRLIGDFNRLCSNSELMDFAIEDYGSFEETKVVFLEIKPSDKLDAFRWSLSQQLQSYCKLSNYDYNKEFNFHATIASHIPSHKFEDVKDYIRNQQKINFNHVIVRVTLLKGGHILREYDFFLRRPLVRSLALNHRVYAHTLNLLKAHFEDKFNPHEFIGNSIKVEEKGVFIKLEDLFRKPKIFITSDLHLDHENIIRMCSRPFLSKEDMNKTLVNNWNNMIGRKDTVYFLGDLAHGRGSDSTDYWLGKLKGKIIFIKGNHDKSDKIKFYDNYILEYGGFRFFLTHDPKTVPPDWKEWVICGHTHNNKPQECPLIDKENKRINISIELTKYRPMDMDELIQLIEG